MKKFTINRIKWARGGKNGSPALINTMGYMSCLGFYELQVGSAPNYQLHATGLPSQLEYESAMCKKAPFSLSTFAESHEDILIACNDDESISEDDREAFIVDYCAAFIDIEVEIW